MALAFGRQLGRRAVVLGGLAPLVATIWLLTELGDVLDGRPAVQRVEWVRALGVGVHLRLDGFAALFAALVTGIGLLVFVYASRYLHDDDRVGRLAGLLTLFAGSMLGLVLADDLLLLYGFWELTSITSYLLIGNDHDDPKARTAALQALLVTSAGALAMLGGFVLLGQAAGTYRVSELVASPPSGGVVPAAIALILLGALTKSAQYPFHAWLPGAMVAPTPVSAYLHSATMVKAGVFLVGRLAPAFAASVTLWRPTLAVLGILTMVAGGLRALRQTDLKLLLAHGTVSQLGFMMVLFGMGTEATVVAGCAMILSHGLFKAALFLVVGIVDHQTGTRDMRELPSLGPGWGVVKAVTLVSAASMAGIPLVFGFVSKDAALAALGDGGFALAGLVLAGVVAGSVLTAAYSVRFAAALLRPAPEWRGGARRGGARPAGAVLVAPAAALAGLTVVLGVVPGLAGELIDAAAGVAEPVHLVLWHGFTPALGLSAGILAGGAALFALRRRVDPLLAAGGALPSGSDAFLALLRGLNHLADRVTGVVQSGSLPIYAGVILTTVAVLTGGALLLAGHWPGWPDAFAAPGHVPIAAAIVGLAVAAATGRRRFAAALFLGAVGYGMAGLFVVQGAPDLALTQVAIETLTTVLFVLVLRRLPGDFERRTPRSRKAVRLGVSAVVAATVFAFAIVAGQSRVAEPISGEMVERALPDGGGRNVVNVILVDFRGLDTLGEITVLAAASIGAVALARAGRRPRPRAPRRAR